MIYVDKDYKCHTEDPEGIYREVETDFFDGKCDAFVEGYRYIPSGESWTRPDGVVFSGEMAAPWKDYGELDAVQRQYEWALMWDMEAALRTMGVRLND